MAIKLLTSENHYRGLAYIFGRGEGKTDHNLILSPSISSNSSHSCNDGDDRNGSRSIGIIIAGRRKVVGHIRIQLLSSLLGGAYVTSASPFLVSCSLGSICLGSSSLRLGCSGGGFWLPFRLSLRVLALTSSSRGIGKAHVVRSASVLFPGTALAACAVPTIISI